jgi:hypothetical protein
MEQTERTAGRRLKQTETPEGDTKDRTAGRR